MWWLRAVVTLSLCRQAEYLEERIPWTPVQFNDNEYVAAHTLRNNTHTHDWFAYSEMCELVEASNGLFAVLDEVCKVGTANGEDVLKRFDGNLRNYSVRGDQQRQARA